MRCAVAILVGLGPVGCSRPEPTFEAPDPGTRLRALERAVASDDRRSIPNLITLLDSDDPAVRLFAVLALRDMTGTTMGYEHAAPEQERRAAADRWEAWYKSGAPAPPPEPEAPEPPAE
ncbi:MAG TPA: HEAT repeat domain-containing protein [Phycisphaerales bacterium]|nr:HEAT repeat domain-containing protein [Phycisphaerales bacterium]